MTNFIFSDILIVLIKNKGIRKRHSIIIAFLNAFNYNYELY